MLPKFKIEGPTQLEKFQIFLNFELGQYSYETEISSEGSQTFIHESSLRYFVNRQNIATFNRTHGITIKMKPILFKKKDKLRYLNNIFRFGSYRETVRTQVTQITSCQNR